MDDTLTVEDGIILRQAARILGKCDEVTLARAVSWIAENYDVPPLCEACDSAAVHMHVGEDCLDLCDQHAR